MQLTNPKQQRAIDEIVSETPKPSTFLRDFVRKTQRDTEIVESVIRTLRHPAHQRLREKLRDLILNI